MKYIYQLTYILFCFDGILRLFGKDYLSSYPNTLLVFVLTGTGLISFCLIHSIHTQINCKQDRTKQSFHTGFLTFLLGYSLAAPAVVALVFSTHLEKLDEPFSNDPIMSIRPYYSAYNTTPSEQIVELIFINDGLLLPYYDEGMGETSSWKKYKPSMQSVKKREEFLLRSKALSDAKDSLRDLLQTNLILLLLKIGIVLLTLLIMTFVQRVLRKNIV